MTFRSGLRKLCLAALSFAVVPAAASAEDYPTKPIRIITSYGGGGEAIARLLGEKIGSTLKQPVVVEPMPAAAGVQAARTVARAAPDGYTLLAGSSITHILKPLTLKAISYDPVRDFTPLTFLYESTTVMAVRADLGITDVPALLERSKNTRTLMGASGVGTMAHVYMVSLNKTTGGALELVPFKDEGSLALNLLGGNVDAAIISGGTISRTLQSADNAQKIRVIGVFSRGPRPGFESVKAVSEQVPGFQTVSVFAALWGPAGMPREIVMRLNAAIREALQDPVIRERMLAMGVIASPGSPEQLDATIRDGLPKVSALLKEAGIEPE